jgi:ubiquinone/menaquinone biosynthesis C-methylase UbiE
VDVAGINAGARVLDIASGRGAVLFPAAERVGADGEVLGIDLADAMVIATNEAAARRGLKARLSVMDAEELTFPDESFDFVTCGFGIMFFPDQDRALAQMRRVLKPGGCLAVSTWRVAQGADLHPALKEMGILAVRILGG